jgi:non-ribosomal peptide synthase protein (TIGR01720 family)
MGEAIGPMSAAQETGGSGLEVAIIGMSGRFPGGRNIERFWRNLCAGIESISHFSPEELEPSMFYPLAASDPHHVRAGGVLEDADRFDAGFFGYSAAEAQLIDPQQRLFLETAWAALEDASCDPETFKGLIGVFGGVGINTYVLSLLGSLSSVELANGLQLLLGSDKDFLSTRVSYKLNLRGPSVTVQTACSTSLVAVHQACQALLAYQCDVALAGGVCVRFPQKAGYPYHEGLITSADGHTRTFDAKATGTVPGNGVGVVVLKRLADALADRDTIYAVIEGSAVNNDGAARVGYTAPSELGQADVIAAALAVAGVEADAIGYVEAHGTGTRLGDPIEVAALRRVFGAQAAAVRCPIGSVKTNVGHLDAAAGVAGLIKAALAVRHGLIPPSLNFNEANPEIDFATTPFYVPTAAVPWTLAGALRRAGVSSFGMGGTNAHVILREAPDPKPARSMRPWHLVVLSAKTASALEMATKNLAKHLEENPEVDLADVSYTSQVGRRAFTHRRVAVCQSRDDALRVLAGAEPARLLRGARPLSGRRVAFLFPGLGDHYVNMAAGVYRCEPVFRWHIDECARVLERELGRDVRAILYPAGEGNGGGSPGAVPPDGPDRRDVDLRRMLHRVGGPADAHSGALGHTALAHPVLFAVEYALAKQWMEWGVRPEAMIGYSLGEYVAACLAGVMTLDEALCLVVRRARLIDQLPTGAMLAVALPEPAVHRYVDSGLSLAAVNAPSVCVIAGPEELVAVLEDRLSADRVVFRRVQTSHAVHSAMMVPIVEPFLREARNVLLRPPSIPYVSNVTGTWMTAVDATDPTYWVRHLVGTVRFADGLGELCRDPTRVLLEVGPGQGLSGFAIQYAAACGHDDCVVIPSVRQAYDPQPDVSVMLTAVGRAWLAGIPIAWERLYPGEHRYRVPLPTYPFEGERYWIGGDVASARAAAGSCSEPSGRRYGRPRLQTPFQAAKTDRERALAAVWQEILNVEEVGVHDSFFELGGDSLLAIRMVSRARDAGIALTPRQVVEHRTIARLAAAAGAVPLVAEAQGPVMGAASLLPIQHWFFDQALPEPAYYNQSLLLQVPPRALDAAVLSAVVRELVRHHDALRARFTRASDGVWTQVIAASENADLCSWHDLSGLADAEQDTAVRAITARLEGSLSLSQGPLLRVALLDRGADRPGILFLTIHHLVVDAFSWRILLEDLRTAYQQMVAGVPVELPRKTSPITRWGAHLVELAKSPTLQGEVAYWRALMRDKIPPLPVDFADGDNEASSAHVVTTRLDVEETRALMHEVPKRYGVQMASALLASVAWSLTRWTGQDSLFLHLEGHGRDALADDVDLSRTLGWFTTLIPVHLRLPRAVDVGGIVQSVAEQVRAIPNGGIGHAVLRYLSRDADLRSMAHPEVSFVYLSQQHADDGFQPYGDPHEAFRLSQSPRGRRPHLIEVFAAIYDRRLTVLWEYSASVHAAGTMERLAERQIETLRSFVSRMAVGPIRTKGRRREAAQWV